LQIQNLFVKNNLKFKCNAPHPILLLKVELPIIDNKAMIDNNHKLSRINNERLHIIASNISKGHSRLKRDWTKD